MKLKLLAILGVTMLTAGGCTIHFPLSDNVPSLTSRDDSTSAAESSPMSSTPTAPSTIDPTQGNTAPTTEVPR